MKRRIQVDVTLPIYDVAPGKCLVPAGLEARTIHPGMTEDLVARVEVARGLVVGFACATEGLRVVRLRVGKHAAHFSSAGFPADAAADGIAIPARSVVVSQEIAATFENCLGMPITPWAHFWIEVDRMPGGR